MEIKITIQEVHIHIDESILPKESILGDWKDILLKAVNESTHKVIDRPGYYRCDNCGTFFTPADKFQLYCKTCESNINAPNANKSAPDANNLTKNAKDKTSMAKTSKAKRENFVHGVTPVKQCRKCGNDYKPTSNVQKYCTDCSHPVKAPKAEKPAKIEKLPADLLPISCRECGTEFIPKNHMERYCSDNCKHLRDKRQQRESAARNREKNNTPKVTAAAKKQPAIKSAQPSVIERPARNIPSGMSGEELIALKEKEGK